MITLILINLICLYSWIQLSAYDRQYEQWWQKNKESYQMYNKLKWERYKSLSQEEKNKNPYWFSGLLSYPMIDYTRLLKEEFGIER